MELQNLPSEERCIRLGLTSLSDRRDRGDNILMFKLFHGLTNIEHEIVELRNQNRTRGNSLKLINKYSRLELRHNYFSVRIVNKWNNLPESVVNANSLSSFKT
jgi:hypothetical protein